ncbi:hypothetical protein AB0N38_14235 [Micromonospora aurantiaca]|uniref:hypothetical protein n=1 Tax=Micromonospora aurantiaca (nom. illeg.) TaxID=47850 RepID=UPI003441BE9F
MARSDIVHEFTGTLNGSGAYASPWIDTAEVDAVTLLWTDLGGSPGSAEVQHSVDGTTNMRSTSVGASGQVVPLGARYFRFVFSAGPANATFHLSVRRGT